jgi:hypothetical protein
MIEIETKIKTKNNNSSNTYLDESTPTNTHLG